MDFKQQIQNSVHVLPVIGETHWIKGALSLQRFSERYPHWKPEVFEEIHARTRWASHPWVDGLLVQHVSRDGQPFTSGNSKVMTARGMFPLAYLAAHHWMEQATFADIVNTYKQRAIHEGTYLGHGWTVWCSFYELSRQIEDRETQQYALERFVEFASKAFPGYPTSNSKWKPPLMDDPGEIDPSAVLDASLDRPGFFGHHLLTLGYLHRHRNILSDVEWRVGLQQVLKMTQLTYIEDEDNVSVPASDVPSHAVTDGDLEQAQLDLMLHGRSDVHSVTVADISHDLWAVCNERQKRHLVHYLRTFCSEQ